jgi:hypothetical protein
VRSASHQIGGAFNGFEPPSVETTAVLTASPTSAKSMQSPVTLSGREMQSVDATDALNDGSTLARNAFSIPRLISFAVLDPVLGSSASTRRASARFRTTSALG